MKKSEVFSVRLPRVWFVKTRVNVAAVTYPSFRFWCLASSSTLDCSEVARLLLKDRRDRVGTVTTPNVERETVVVTPQLLIL